MRLRHRLAERAWIAVAWLWGQTHRKETARSPRFRVTLSCGDVILVVDPPHLGDVYLCRQSPLNKPTRVIAIEGIGFGP